MAGRSRRTGACRRAGRTRLALWIAVGILFLLVPVAWWKHQPRYHFLQYLYFLRFEAGGALLLVLLPALAWVDALRPLLGNLFVLHPLQIFPVAFLSVLSAWAISQTFALHYFSASVRTSLARPKPRLRSFVWKSFPPMKDPRHTYRTAFAPFLFMGFSYLFFLVAGCPYFLRFTSAAAPRFPALAFVLILLTFVVQSLSLMAYVLDVLRVPVLLAVGAVSFVLSMTFGADYHYRTQPVPAREASELTPTRA